MPKGALPRPWAAGREKIEMENADFLLALVRGISHQDLVNRLTFNKADIWGMISSGVVCSQEAFFFKRTLRVSVWQPHTCNPT